MKMKILKTKTGKIIVRLLIASVIFGLGIFLGSLIEKYVYSLGNNISGFQIRQDRESGSLIRPLLLCGVNTPTSERYRALAEKIKQTVDNEVNQKKASKISVYFRDLDTGEWAGVNEDEHYAPASMLKVPTMIAYYKLAENYPEILLKKFLYDGSFDDNRSEVIKPQKAIQPGQKYAVDELIKYMIVYSDNNALRLLKQNINQNLLSDIYSDLEIPLPENRQIDFMSGKIYSRFFRALYNSTYLDRVMSQKALELLSQIDFPQGITGGLPSGVVAAQKFGERSIYSPDGLLIAYELHDCGIIYFQPRPYLLCVMTKGNDFNRLTEVIRGISRLIYREISRQPTLAVERI